MEKTIEQRKENIKNIFNRKSVFIIIGILWVGSLWGMNYYMTNEDTEEDRLFYQFGFEDGMDYGMDSVIKMMYNSSIDCSQLTDYKIDEVNDSLVFFPYSCIGSGIMNR